MATARLKLMRQQFTVAGKLAFTTLGHPVLKGSISVSMFFSIMSWVPLLAPSILPSRFPLNQPIVQRGVVGETLIMGLFLP